MPFETLTNGARTIAEKSRLHGCLIAASELGMPGALQEGAGKERLEWKTTRERKRTQHSCPLKRQGL